MRRVIHQMRVEVLAIGTELLDGRVADTNTLFLAPVLAELGLKIAQRTTVGDDVTAIVEAAQEIARRGSEFCVVSGGLGPTRDDLTEEAFACLVRVEEGLADAGPAEAKPVWTSIDNRLGSAPGLLVPYGKCLFILLPGVPREFEAMVSSDLKSILPGGATSISQARLRSYGLSEKEVENCIGDLAERFVNLRIGYRIDFPEVHISLADESGDEEAFKEALHLARERLGIHVFSERRGPFASEVIAKLVAHQESVAVAESCTGGLVGDLLTNVDGASGAFKMGIVAYSNEAKISQLGIGVDAIKRDGAVSEEVVLAMAEAVRHCAGATYGLAVSGIAGPSGGSPQKPVGTVWLALKGPDILRTRHLVFPWDRRRNKVASAYAAIHLLREALPIEDP